MKNKTEDKKNTVDPMSDVEIMPLKNHEIHWNHIDIIIKEGDLVAIPRLFLQNMVTEGVIKSLLKEG